MPRGIELPLRLLGVVCGLVSASCIRVAPFRCSSDADCVDVAGPGTCEPTWYCSYPDDECASMRRYSELAGPHADACVPAEDSTTQAGTGDVETVGSETVGSETGSSETGTPSVPGGTIVWSDVLAGDADGEDRFDGLVHLADGDVVAVGMETDLSQDLLLVRLTPDGDVVRHVTHDLDFLSDDEALAAVQSPDGELWLCGRADHDGAPRAWLGMIDASLEGTPGPSAMPTHQTCRDIAVIGTDAVIAMGDDYDLGGGAWTYVFPPWNPAMPTTGSESMDANDTWVVAARSSSGRLLLGGTLGERGVVAELVADTDAPGPALVMTDGIGAIQGLAIDGEGFVAGGFESALAVASPWVSAWQSDGVTRWSWRPDEPAILDDEIEAVAVDGSGHTVAVGFVTGGARERWIVRLDPDGQLLWSVVLPTHVEGGHDIARDVIALPDDSVIVAGEVEDADGVLDAWIARMTP